MKTHQVLPAMFLIVILASCAYSPSASDIPTSVTPENNQPAQATAQMPSNNSSGNQISPMNTPDFSEISPPPPETNPFVKLAEEDLASRLSINLDQVHFLKISDIDWQDITQGCTSSPGQTLTKGRVSGYRIWLEANGENYLYHIGLDNTIFLCPE